MDFIVNNISWILYVTGVMTAGMIVGVIAPDTIAKSAIGRATHDGAERLIVRHWTFMIGVLGVLLIIAGYTPEYREPVMILAIAEKLLIIALMLGNRDKIGDANPLPIVVADGTMSVLYIAYLIAA